MMFYAHSNMFIFAKIIKIIVNIFYFFKLPSSSELYTTDTLFIFFFGKICNLMHIFDYILNKNHCNLKSFRKCLKGYFSHPKTSSHSC